MGRLAALEGARAGCQGSRACLRAVGLLYSTQTGNTETVAGIIAEAAGIEATPIDDIDAADLAGYDGLIVGTPTWNTGADEFRSGTTWDDYLEDIKALDLKGKPVAVFGCGDSQGYGDNFCDAIEEMHSTFKAAGAKMLGAVDSSGYSHSESKSEQDGKFLGFAAGPGQRGRPDGGPRERVGLTAEVRGHASLRPGANGFGPRTCRSARALLLSFVSSAKL